MRAEEIVAATRDGELAAQTPVTADVLGRRGFRLGPDGLHRRGSGGQYPCYEIVLDVERQTSERVHYAWPGARVTRRDSLEWPASEAELARLLR